ncbi:MAG: hypothetical protein LCH37_07710 [Bacteroidetes bacterium]|nr:hypothetical protein [Bacteroidota bacterium]
MGGLKKSTHQPIMFVELGQVACNLQRIKFTNHPPMSKPYSGDFPPEPEKYEEHEIVATYLEYKDRLSKDYIAIVCSITSDELDRILQKHGLSEG